MNISIPRRQGGFTLVEIAIVLVIIGVLLVGVLQGQEMIDNTKTKSIVNSMKGIQVAYNGYLDRYKVPPGDEAVATYTARGWANTVGGNANGVFNGVLASTFTNAAAETSAFWQALRGSGLISGAANAVGATALPQHGANGPLGIAGGGALTVYGNTGLHVCAANLSTKQVAAIDVIIDGPLPANNIGNNVGNLRAGTGVATPLAPIAGAPPALAYNETATTTPWTACMRIG
jgi:prepilin-type N-terminal cleavage/methylation domain-containing protein